jgi:hypothetical protein
MLVNELSGDRAFETLRITTQWHKLSASEGFFAVAHYVEQQAKAVGLQDVRWIDQVAESAAWTCKRADAWLLEEDGKAVKQTRLGTYAEVATSIADFSRPADVTADLVDVGAGDSAADYDGKDVRGKIVLSYGSPSAVMAQAVWKRGAAGILSYSSTRLNALAEYPDQIAWQSVPEKDGPNGEKTTFAFILSSNNLTVLDTTPPERRGLELRLGSGLEVHREARAHRLAKRVREAHGCRLSRKRAGKTCHGPVQTPCARLTGTVASAPQTELAEPAAPLASLTWRRLEASPTKYGRHKRLWHLR